jgi:hypothetical protein
MTVTTKTKPVQKTAIVKIPTKVLPLTPMQIKTNLEAARKPVMFDPDDKAHRTAFAHFLVNKRWPDGVRFIEEWPHTSAVTTIQTKLTHFALRKEMAALDQVNIALSKASQ